MIFKEYNTKERCSSYGTGRNILWNNSQSLVTRSTDTVCTAWGAIRQSSQVFYHLSPYAYCAGDPVNLVDPDGRKIYFADGVPEWFKERFAATIQYMNEKGTSWIFKKLQDSGNIYKINYIDDDNIMYDPEKK